MSELGGQLRHLVAQLSLAQRLWIAGAAAASALLMVAFVAIAGQPDYQPAFTRLSPTTAGAISASLRTAKIPFQVTDAGATILVPTSQVSAARVAAGTAASAGSDTQGFSLFDNTGLGMSQFDEQVTYQRALQGELTQTIEAMDGVASAQVAIVPAQQGLFASQDQPASASVMVQMRDGQAPSDALVRGVAATVAGAVPGLTPDNVTVVDEAGHVLAGPGDTVGTDAMTAQAQIQRDDEAKVEELLDQTLGPAHAAVSVAATLDFDKVQQQVTTYTPVNTGQWTPVSVQRSTETYTGSGAATAGGIPGAESNVPGLVTYPGVPQATAAPAGSSMPGASAAPTPSVAPTPSASPIASAGPTASPAYSKTQETVNYDLSQTVANIVKQPGSIERLSVAVLVDQQALNGINPDVLKQSIAAAIGVDPTRGDVVSLTAVPFARPLATSAGPLPPGALQQAGSMVPSALGILIGLALLFVFWRNTRALRRRGEEITVLGAPGLRELGAGTANAAIGAMPEAPELAEGSPHARVQQQLRTVADQRPDALVNLMNQWLIDEAGRR